MTGTAGSKDRLVRAAPLLVLAAVAAYLLWFGKRQGRSFTGLWELVVRNEITALRDELARSNPGRVNAPDAQGRTALHWAAALERPEAVEALLKAGADANAMDKSNFSPIHLAVDRADLVVLDMLFRHGGNPNHRHRLGVSAFDLSLRRVPPVIRANHRGMQYGHQPESDPAPAGSERHLRLVRRMLEAGADVNGPFQPSGIAPLNEAVDELPIEFVRMLLDFGADPNRSDGSDNTPMHVAVRKHRKDVFELLRARGVGVNVQGGNGATPLFVAAEQLNLEWIDLLLAHGADPGIRSKRGQTAIYAAFTDFRERLTEDWSQSMPDGRDQALFAVCERLIRAGCDVRRGDQDGITPLHLAAEHPGCPTALLDLLIEKGADVNARDRFGESPALHARNARIVPRLLARGADPDVESRVGFSLFRSAAARNDWTQFDFLLAASKRVWSDESFRTRRLLDLLSNDRCPVDVAERLLQAGVSVALTTDGWTGHTALHLAARVGRVDLAARLIQAGADPNVRDAVGRTPLHHAAERALDLPTIQCLAFAGAEIDAQDAYRRTPLHAAIEAAVETIDCERAPDHRGVVGILLEWGADPNYGPMARLPEEQAGRPFLPPLDLAVARDLFDIAELLIERGADPSSRHPETQTTAIHLAAMQQPEHVRLLLRHGADPKSRDRDGRTPLHYAVARCTSPETIRELIQAGADVKAADDRGYRPVDIANGRVSARDYYNLHHRFEITVRQGNLLEPSSASVRDALQKRAARLATAPRGANAP